MSADSPRVPEAAQPEKALVGAPDKERPDAREEGRASLFYALRQWALEHLDALDEDVVEADGEGILNSLRMVLEGNVGCLEEGDYDPDRWAVLMAAREAVTSV